MVFRFITRRLKQPKYNLRNPNNHREIIGHFGLPSSVFRPKSEENMSTGRIGITDFLLIDSTFDKRFDIQCRKDPKPIKKNFTMLGRMELDLFWG
jgi:hypothetical protein